ncbi:MAG TPA: hypothetical protein VGI92_00315 [Gemmatimonadales bacterium]|jgi:hypothetical protein
MQVTITQEIADALKSLHDVPDELRARIAAIAPAGGALVLKLSDDEATSMAELLQWHMRTDPTTGQPTPQTAIFGELIRRIDEAQFA